MATLAVPIFYQWAGGPYVWKQVYLTAKVNCFEWLQVVQVVQSTTDVFWSKMINLYKRWQVLCWSKAKLDCLWNAALSSTHDHPASLIQHSISSEPYIAPKPQPLLDLWLFLEFFHVPLLDPWTLPCEHSAKIPFIFQDTGENSISFDQDKSSERFLNTNSNASSSSAYTGELVGEW